MPHRTKTKEDVLKARTNNPTNLWGDALFNSPNIAVTLQVTGRFADVKNPILAATSSPTTSPTSSPTSSARPVAFR
jgi:hypothetical protein